MIRCITAIDSKRGLGNDAGIPWQGKLPADVAYFRTTTDGKVVLMGYATYLELASPLPDRHNVVASSGQRSLRPDFELAPDARSYLEHTSDDVWVIGGAGLFSATLDLAQELYLTRIDGDFVCTKFFPAYAEAFDRVTSSDPEEQNGISFRFEVWRRDP